MTATDVVRGKWIASYALNAADTLAHLAQVYGDVAVVDGELYAIDAEDGGSPGRWVHLVPPSGETAE